MSDYDILAKFYDDIMGDQKEFAQKVYRLIRSHLPRAGSLLELGCGTGSYLQYLSKYYKTTGVDSSSVMLSVAREKLPDTELYQASMIELNLDRKFDVIICMNDTINHFTKISEIKRIFSSCYENLTDNGILIFDINTVHKLESLSDCPPIVHQFRENYFITNVSRTTKDIYEWDLRIFENISDSTYKLHEELLYERSYTIAQLKDYLGNKFKNIRFLDLNNKKISKKSERLHFICTKYVLKNSCS
ncbi:MAG: class I SAM-dependent methyltransferase [Candidatus Dadabacteria bacterium]|nr:class I SAM-dependent methyltransferase [Candidatus Dadabacteria bacterium]NIS08731.1 class I SAM-dependent methyltransferase [Candidatus Dadabacteria bacterium]NIV42615.1 methyltransferase domain-containing protein [Candidatus Dadabacteria bacterium]NIX15417.1 methyltransferase domain-containing protein [Candidatus Dadabacteria bacterium]NIY22080.1 methyltransferase domain-containing protein [Candidatus Dadabacteria bacterium]